MPDLPDPIEMTRSQLPFFLRNDGGGGGHNNHKGNKNSKSDDNIFGAAVNSFYELESGYVEYMRRELGRKAWLVGPVSLCNKHAADKAERGQKADIDEQSILNWLDSKQPNSVVYISFGSVAACLPPEQLLEIANGLEASAQSFIWVVGKSGENWLPVVGFEQKMRESEKGLIIRGWAPQLLILEHGAVGGFMTHCGWNSVLEAVCSGVPMITWPMSAEQFSNEKLVTDVLKIGVKVGSMDWGISWKKEPRVAVVSREKVEASVKRVMGDDGEEKAAEMRRRAREMGDKAKRAVEDGGSSYLDADALIQELKIRRSGGTRRGYRGQLL